MSTIDRGAKRRARRIAADEAHAWARNLRLNNAHAKLTLSMLSLYVDGDGYCFVSIPTLADDTELSSQTIRSRLSWLEQIGAIARLPQWIDEYGHRNADARGRRTSDLIRLMIDCDDEIEAAVGRAAGDVSREVAPMPQTGSNPGSETADPTLTLRRPYDSVEGLISEPEPESPLKAPQGAESETPSAVQAEPEHFGPAWVAWPGHEVMRRDLALAEFRLLSPADQVLCRAAIAPFAQMQQRLGRKHPPNFHIWIRNRGFSEFPGAKLEAVAGTGGSFAEASPEGRAIKALYAFARTPLFINHGRVVYPLPVTTRVLAFAEAGDQAAWQWITEPAQIAAWRAFLAPHIHRQHPDLVVTRGDGTRGMIAPWPWPPRKDGTISETQMSEGEE